MKIATLCLSLSSVALAYESPSPSPSAYQSPVALTRSCSAKVTCDNGDEIQCSAEGPAPLCTSGKKPDKRKFVNCDDDITKIPDGIDQICP